MADKAAHVGQPEVKLGIIPGAAGTQRLPRLAGVEKALEMCVSGAPVKADDALAAGIVDQLIEGDLLIGALAFLRAKIASGATPPKTRERNDNLDDEGTNAPIFTAAREKAKKTARGLSAPFAAIDAIEAATKLPFDEGAKILEEGYALRAGDIDIVYLNGYSFPAWRGGPMWYAGTVGVKNVYDRVCAFHAEHGAWWEPAPLLKQLAETGRTFAAWDKEKEN